MNDACILRSNPGVNRFPTPASRERDQLRATAGDWFKSGGQDFSLVCDFADLPAYGTNVIPFQIDRAALLEGYRTLMTDLAEPDAYFDRLESLYLEGGIGAVSGRHRYWRRHPLRRLTANAVFVVQTAVLFARLMRGVPESDLRRQYRRRVWRIVVGRREPSLAFLYVIRCASHYHSWRLAKDMAGGRITNAL